MLTSYKNLVRVAVLLTSLLALHNLYSQTKGAATPPSYPNLFTELLGQKESAVQARIDSAFAQLFHGAPETQCVYYPVSTDMAYIKDILHNDVRTEGMSYGMMVSVQLNKKQEFDRLWKWSKTFMQHYHGAHRSYFAWHCAPDGRKLDENAASDGEEWFVMALFFASARWGNGEGIFNYQREAQTILDAMFSKADSSNCDNVVTNMFNRREKQVVFVPVGNADDFTDPSYHLPHFYELWSLWTNKENDFWRQAAAASRTFLKKAAHPGTGLTPDYARFDGSAVDAPWGGGHDDFRYDAWRTAMNIAVDYTWFHRDAWAIEQSNRLLDFFHAQGIDRYGNLYTLAGKMLGPDHSTGLVAMNCVACLASDRPFRREFVAALWNAAVPSGNARYYDGLLYLLGLLQVGGQFRIYSPTGR